MKTNPRFVRFLCLCSVFAVSFFVVANAYGQAYGRIAFFAQSANTNDKVGNDSNFQEYVTNITLQSGEIEEGFEYGADMRLASYPNDEESRRVSIYNAYVGRKFNNHFGVRGGQMWLNELSALGSLGGVVAQVRTSKKVCRLFACWRVWWSRTQEPRCRLCKWDH